MVSTYFEMKEVFFLGGLRGLKVARSLAFPSSFSGVWISELIMLSSCLGMELLSENVIILL